MTVTQRVSVRTFERMALRNLTLRGVDLTGLEPEEEIALLQEGYEDEATRRPINRAARRAHARIVRGAATIQRHLAWYRAEAEHRKASA